MEEELLELSWLWKKTALEMLIVRKVNQQAVQSLQTKCCWRARRCWSGISMLPGSLLPPRLDQRSLEPGARRCRRFWIAGEPMESLLLLRSRYATTTM